uniref:Tubulin beta-5 chain n=1 Tax=Rhizophora mucronata TaxID=61149 RepID=A0A2P2KXM2_RHIMU
MSTTMRHLAGDLYPEPCSWTWSLAPWTASELVRMARYLGLITLCLDNLVLETTGLRATTLKVPSLLMWFLTL